jgi:hypothetical protein
MLIIIIIISHLFCSYDNAELKANVLHKNDNKHLGLGGESGCKHLVHRHCKGRVENAR